MNAPYPRLARLVLQLRGAAEEMLKEGIAEQLHPADRELADGVLEACKRYEAARSFLPSKQRLAAELPYDVVDVRHMRVKRVNGERRWDITLASGRVVEVDHDTAGRTFVLGRHLTEANITDDDG